VRELEAATSANAKGYKSAQRAAGSSVVGGVDSDCGKAESLLPGVLYVHSVFTP